ncbi:MAG TPA: serine hydrolase domain-containing protein [Alphaproteobacteria bacterium]|nr:serine hydrolase domain-containing protein [Alphaproteobacteria bacterium]
MELLRALELFLAENVKGVSVDAQAVLVHVIRPPNYQSASSDRGTEESPVLFRPGPPPGVEPYYLDVGTFQVALHNALKDVVAGYVAQLRQSGQIRFTSEWQYAQRPQDGSEWWAPGVQMHVASVSKLMTAMAMMVLFRDNNISPDALITDYLPDYWVEGPNVEYITFRNLFNHTSGLSASDLVDFEIMKSAIAGGINPGARGQYNYQNLNYALCRILLAVINGNINKNAYFDPPPIPGFPPQPWNDILWDYVTVTAYEAYLQANVFQPSGVVGATLDHPPGCALAYRVPDDAEPGWNSGSLEESCGYAGWHLSVNELLDVMGEFRRGGGILTPAAAQAMLDNGFGVDPFTGGPLPAALTTLAGNVYCKPGDWHDPNNQDEQSLAFFLPEDMELVVLVNSMVDGQTGPPNNYFRCVVTQAYLDNLTTQPPIIHQ